MAGPNCYWIDSPAWTGRGGSCHRDPCWDLEAAEAEVPENVTMDMLFKEARGLERDIGETFRRYEAGKATAAGTSWRMPRFEKD